ncbi:MAG: hypothetical protein U9N56_02695 [Actinomycetota bacterium]|nr:hypothetical protein [Actinomycetota bacterium]
MSRTIDTLLLLALPASGKSELRRYLGHLDPDVAERDLHLGPVVQLDDYPYVHMMRRISEELASAGEPAPFFEASDRPFSESRDWGTLIHLLNEDYSALGSNLPVPESAAFWLFERLDRARGKVGITPTLRDLSSAARERQAEILEDESTALWTGVSEAASSWQEGSTVVIEFARGGPRSAEMPLSPPHGYAYSLAKLSDDIKRRASILYVWVTPEESRRRNVERARPGRNGDASILFHGVPESVMHEEYGLDDFSWLVDRGDGRSITIGNDGKEWEIPAAVFDNRPDRTTFLRSEPGEWPEDEVATLHATLVETFDQLA